MRVLVVLGLCVLACSAAAAAPDGQIRLTQTSDEQSGRNWNTYDWDLSRPPATNTTGHLIFDTFNSFLKLWPNTRLRNGHNIAAAVVPVGTLLHHGTMVQAIPSGPEWLATDPDHAYAFCRNWNYDGKGCWQLTLVATRPLRVLYFDGSSAAKMWGGTFDSQDILLWGGIQPNRTLDERVRIKELCDWGTKYSIDGYLRMEADFEIMMCNFTAGVEVISFLNLFPVTGNDGDPQPHLLRGAFRAIEAGKWHDRHPSERRIQIDYSRVISFYDTTLFPNLNKYRFGQERWDHRLKMINPEEVATLYRTLDEILPGPWGISRNGIDWPSLLTVVDQKYNERLEMLRYILSDRPTDRGTYQGVEDILKQAHRYVQDMMAQYILNSNYPPSTSHSKRIPASDLAPTYKLCATTHTQYLRSSHVYSTLAPSEKLLVGGVEETLREICRVLIGMWAEGVEDGLLSAPLESAHQRSQHKALLQRWQCRIQDLTDWLDWSSWSRCEPACSYEEICYMPTWPFFKRLPRGPIPKHRDQNNTSVVNDSGVPDDEPNEPGQDDDWYRPRPRCIRRLEPFGIML